MLNQRGFISAGLFAQYRPSSQNAVAVSAQKVEHPEIRWAVGRTSTDVDRAELVVLVKIDSLRMDDFRVLEYRWPSKKLLSFSSNLCVHSLAAKARQQLLAGHLAMSYNLLIEGQRS